MSRIHFSNISDYCAALGKAAPIHPLFNISKVEAGGVNCLSSDCSVTTDFYAIALKNVVSGKLLYGKTEFDFQNGTMVFFAPNQVFATNGIKVESEGKVIMFHRDFIRGHEIEGIINKSSFFGYAVNEALHLSTKEESLVESILETIELECSGHYDEFSRDIILSQITTLLKYADRFYRRQFLLRQESTGSLYDKFIVGLDKLLAQSNRDELPKIQDVADVLNMTSRYLTDGLRAETGKSAKEWILLHLIDRAKSRLLESDESVATIAYSLGFEYPQYFARLFKKKVGVTPTDYRKLH